MSGNEFDAFLSHNNHEKSQVEQIADRLLEDYGIHSWLDLWDLTAGSDWANETEKALGSCASCVSFLGAHGWGQYHLKESQYALNRRQREAGFRVILVLLPGASSKDMALLGDFSKHTQWLDFRNGLDDSEAFQRLAAAIRGELPFPEGRPRMSAYVVRRDARRWEQTSRKDKSVLYRGSQLREAQRIGQEHPEQLNAVAVRFLSTSAIEEQRGTRRLVLSLIFIVLAIAALSLLAWIQRNDAVTAQGVAEIHRQTAVAEADARATAQADAESQRQAAEKERTIAVSRELASAAITNLEIDPERSILLAVQALKAAYTFESEDALRRALFASHVRATLRGHNPSGKTLDGRTSNWVKSAIYNPAGSWVLTSGGDGTARIWDAATGSEIRVLRGHTAWVNTAVFDPSGQLVVTASGDKTARIWEAATGRALQILRGHDGEVHTAVFSPDGHQIITSSEDGTARVWETATGRLLLSLSGHRGAVTSAAVSSDSRWILTVGADRTARIWDATTGKSRLVIEDLSSPFPIAIFSPDSRFVVTANSDLTAQLWDIATGKQVRLFSQTALVGAAFETLSFSHDGRWLLAAGLDAYVYDIATGATLATLRGHQLSIWSAAFSPDDQFIVTASEDGTARVWELLTGQTVAIFRGHTARVASAAFSPDGHSITTASADGTARIWEVMGNEIAAYPGASGIRSFFSPSARLLATVNSDNSISVKRADPALPPVKLQAREERLGPIGFDPSESWVVMSYYGGLLRIADVASGADVAILRTLDSEYLYPVFSPNGRWVAAISYGGVLHVWDARSWQEVNQLKGSTDQNYQIGFSPDNKWLASIIKVPSDNGSQATVIRVMSVNTWTVETVLREHDPSSQVTTDMMFSPDGKWLAAANSSRALIWRTDTWAKTVTLVGHSNDIVSLHYSPDSQWLVTASRDDTARVWKIVDGQEQVTLRGHDGYVNSAVYSGDGQSIVTGSEDGTARLWNAHTGSLLAILGGSSEPIDRVAFQSDGRRIITSNRRGEVRVYATSVDELVRQAQQRVTRGITCEERQTFLHEQTSCP
jgi:WD40 repeat protein